MHAVHSWAALTLEVLDSEIIGQICRFLPFYTNTKMSKRNSGVTEPNLTKFEHDVAACNSLLICRSAFWYFNPFSNGSVTMKLRLPKTPILCLKLVAMTASLERLPNVCRIYKDVTQLHQPWKFGEDLSSSLFPDISLLRSIIKKSKYQKHRQNISPQDKFARLAK